MAGSKINDFAIGDSNIQSVMLTLDKTFKGLHHVSLTNYDNTSESQIAAGSVVENNGALYQFTSNESITGTPSDGTVYIRLVPSGDTITAEYTNTAPTWSDSKQGWYGTGGDANKRYLNFILTKTGSVWFKTLQEFEPSTLITVDGTWVAPKSKYYEVWITGTGGAGLAPPPIAPDYGGSGGGAGATGYKKLFIVKGDTWTAAFTTGSSNSTSFTNGTTTISARNGGDASSAPHPNNPGSGGSSTAGCDFTFRGGDGDQGKFDAITSDYGPQGGNGGGSFWGGGPKGAMQKSDGSGYSGAGTYGTGGRGGSFKHPYSINPGLGHKGCILIK